MRQSELTKSTEQAIEKAMGELRAALRDLRKTGVAGDVVLSLITDAETTLKSAGDTIEKELA